MSETQSGGEAESYADWPKSRTSLGTGSTIHITDGWYTVFSTDGGAFITLDRQEDRAVSGNERQTALDRALADEADLRRRIRDEIDHSYFNGHILDARSQGVAPGERVPAVRVAGIEAVLECPPLSRRRDETR